MTLEELRERVLQYDMLELPGQSPMMHMGTNYLVHDLLRYAEQLQRERDEAVSSLRETYTLFDSIGHPVKQLVWTGEMQDRAKAILAKYEGGQDDT